MSNPKSCKTSALRGEYKKELPAALGAGAGGGAGGSASGDGAWGGGRLRDMICGGDFFRGGGGPGHKQKQ